MGSHLYRTSAPPVAWPVARGLRARGWVPLRSTFTLRPVLCTRDRAAQRAVGGGGAAAPGALLVWKSEAGGGLPAPRIGLAPGPEPRTCPVKTRAANKRNEWSSYSEKRE